MKSSKRLVLALLVLLPAAAGCSPDSAGEKSAEAKETAVANEVTISPQAMKSSGIVIEVVGPRPADRAIQFTGTVEANQQATQQVTPLVSGRVERVNAALGNRVTRGSLLATIVSPEVAEMHGKLIEAGARLNLASRSLDRTRRLEKLGAAAGKDLNAAEAEIQTAQAEVDHLRNALRALGALPEAGAHNIALVALQAPISGVVTERTVNPGSGVEPGKPLFTIANLSEVWVIANVPESQVSLLHPGAGAEVRASALGTTAVRGTVSYIDPNLNEQTRTARVRVSVANRNELLKIGMFCEVSITPTAGNAATEPLMVAESAVQRIGDRTVVFVEKSPGRFEVRNVGLAEKVAGYRIVAAGLTAGERVVTSGSFTVKSQLLKSQFAESD